MKEIDLDSLTALLAAHTEWILAGEFGKTFAIQNTEMEIETEHDKVLFSFLDDKGYRTWRVVGAWYENSKILLDLARNFSTEQTKLQLIPRVAAEQLRDAVELARLEKATKIANLIISQFKNTNLVRVELNKENGRFAQIVLRPKIGNEIAVLCDVSEKVPIEGVLTTGIIWLSKLQRRKKHPIDDIWILSRTRKAPELRKLHACLAETWKSKISIFRIFTKSSETKIEEMKTLKISGLWRFKPTKLAAIGNRSLSKISNEIIKLAPERMDHVFSKSGETLRYLGIPFLRVREICGEEKAWFGVERKRRALNEETHEDFYELVENLKVYRSHKSPNRFHLFYDNAPEAWLESILRKNIKLLDENLILSPIYNQFRTSRDKIDLLALRKDGRLVIIELKVSQDREMIFQAVDYWRKIEHQRRKGKFDDASLFGEKKIADKPAIIYLAAPALSYHPDFAFLTKTISEEIEIFRFDLAENWRDEIRVLGRKRI